MGEEDAQVATAPQNSTSLQAAFKKLKIDPEWNPAVISTKDSDSIHTLWAGKHLTGKARSSREQTCRPKGGGGKGCISHKSSRTEPYTLDCINTMQHLSFKSELCTKANCGCKKSKLEKGWCHASGLLFVPGSSSAQHKGVWDDKLRMRNSEKDRKQIIRSAKLHLLREGKGFQAQPFFPFGKILKKGRFCQPSSTCPSSSSSVTKTLPVFGCEAEPSPDFLSVCQSVSTSSHTASHGTDTPSSVPFSFTTADKVLFSDCASRPTKRGVETAGAEGGSDSASQQGLKRKSPSRLKPFPSSGKLDRKHGKTCSQQAKISVEDFSVNELASYFENYVYIPKKMSSMAEMMYT